MSAVRLLQIDGELPNTDQCWKLAEPKWATPFRKGIIYMSTVDLESFIDAIVGKRLTYERLIAKVGA